MSIFKIIFFICVALLLADSSPDANAVADAGSIKDGLDRIENNIATAGSGLRTGSSAFDVVQVVVNWLLSLAGILALAALITGGILFIISFGNEDRAKLAKRIIIYAVIGLVVIGLSFLILNIVKTQLTA